MSIFEGRLDRAIKASGKTAEEIARVVQVTPTHLSRLRKGKEENPEIQLVIRIARETGTTVGALLGESIQLSADDEQELLRFRGWIDDKLATIDTSKEPNAGIVSSRAQSQVRSATRVAERPRQRIDNPFDANVHLELRALGDSMIDAGILADDTLYAIPPAADAASMIGTIVACRIGDGIFVKRLVREHRSLYLLSAHPRYRPIAADPKTLEILGTIAGRIGRIR